jgi:hypothetical protein
MQKRYPYTVSDGVAWGCLTYYYPNHGHIHFYNFGQSLRT